MRQLVLLTTLLLTAMSAAQPLDEFDYFTANRTMIRNGVQAVLMCNGLFTSGRTLEQIFAQELAYLPAPVGSVEGGEYIIDRERRAVAIGGPASGPVIRAAFRDGIGCVVMAPNQSFDDIDALPVLALPYPDGDPAILPWPIGDVLDPDLMPTNVDWTALNAASDWAFDRESAQQVTLSLIVVHNGQIVLERYADGVKMTTRTRTWSTAKSIAATLIGILVDDGRLELDAPLGIEWLPDVGGDENDPRATITLRHVLNMSSGLDPVDSFGMEYATGSGLAYWAGASSVDGARRRALLRKPGTRWDYENYDTLLAVYAMKRVLGDASTYAEFPRKALLDRIGMRNTLVSTDRFGDFVFSSQVYTNARDLARFGLLYVQGGVWQGERLLSKEWIDFVRTPAAAAASRGNDYGGQFWLVPDDREDVPKSAYSTAGNRGQYVIVVPSHDTVIVRRGLDYGGQGFNRWDLTREVLKAIETD
ncbi:MAG: serine hydrolase [Woeseiaceae bacterium]